jgi:hypothetical protein
MKEDNNIKPLISAILNLSLKLSKCQNAKTTPKAVTKTTPKAVTKTTPKAVTKTTPKAVTKITPKAVTKTMPKSIRHNMKGGGSAEFFE